MARRTKTNTNRRRISWPPPRITAEAWPQLSIADRVELVAAIEELGEAVVVALERAGLAVEEYARHRYRGVRRTPGSLRAMAGAERARSLTPRRGRA